MIARKNDEVIRHGIENRGHLRNVARGFLDANDVFDFSKPPHRSRLDIHSRAALHTVENDGQGNRFGNRPIVLEKAFLRRLVVIRSDGENSIHAKTRKLAPECNHFGGVVASSTGEDRNPSLSGLDGDLYDAQMFFVRKRGALACCAARHKKVDASVDLPLDQTPKRSFIERTIAAKRSDKRSAGTCKHDVVPFFFSAQFAENLAKFVNASFANGPPRRPERPARKTFAAP